MNGYSGDGEIATSANLRSPTYLSYAPLGGSLGGLLVADQGNNRVIRIDLSSGIISTVAGSGNQSGYAGDGASAIGASLSLPYHAIYGPDGCIYIADQGNSVIRRVDTQGTISTFAGSSGSGMSGDGGLASLARLDHPYALAFHKDTLYIVDSYNCRIRMVSLSTGIINTYAGSSCGLSALQLNYPSFIIFDSLGNAFVSDQGNNRVQRIDASGSVSTYIGTGLASDGFGSVHAPRYFMMYFLVPAGLIVNQLVTPLPSKDNHELLLCLNCPLVAKHSSSNCLPSSLSLRHIADS